MRLLVLGGTRLVGRGLAAAALAAGHEVTLFHRGVTGVDVHPEAEHLTGDREVSLDALTGREWDACVDVSGYLPGQVRAAAEALHGAVGWFVFVSTISVYASLAEPTDETGLLATLPAGKSENELTGESYGALKVLGEQTVREWFGERATIVRPGYVVGPHDHTGRFTWWLRRAAEGGRMPIPASIHERAQFIDAHDLGTFLLLAAEKRLPGVYNATGPVPPVGMREVLELASLEAGVPLELVPVPDETVATNGISYPLWVHGPAWRAWADVVVARARSAGLHYRPLVDTVRETLAHGPAVEGVGPGRADEARLLTAV
ncbi:MAG: NAD-dependent epimerase/dehydratase family protein [Gaiellales bacterium]